jgi:hypothetical protein
LKGKDVLRFFHYVCTSLETTSFDISFKQFGIYFENQDDECITEMTDETQELIMKKEGLLRLYERRDALKTERKIENMYVHSN